MMIKTYLLTYILLLFFYQSKLVEIPSGQLFKNVQTVDIYPGFALEGLPNRDSLSYSEIYHIPETETMFRGTLRYKVRFKDMLFNFLKITFIFFF